MVTVLRAERKSAVLTPSSLQCLSRIPTINLTAGCAIGCIYCYALGYPHNPGEGRVVLNVNTLDKLRAELARKRSKPRAVYFSPSTDIFQPVPEVLELGHQILDFLLSQDIGVAFVTKGRIPENTMKLLLANPDKVRAQIGLITLDRDLLRIFEPNAASPEVRLRQMSALIGADVPTVARLAPVLPGLTDAPEPLDRLLAGIAATGVRHITTSTLFLRPVIWELIKRSIGHRERWNTLIGSYKGARRIPVRAQYSSVVALSEARRVETYDCLRDLAKKHGLRLSVCSCMNPDIGAGTCNITGRWPRLPQSQQIDGVARDEELSETLQDDP